jgi:hypothetical protein
MAMARTWGAAVGGTDLRSRTEEPMSLQKTGGEIGAGKKIPRGWKISLPRGGLEIVPPLRNRDWNPLASGLRHGEAILNSN